MVINYYNRMAIASRFNNGNEMNTNLLKRKNMNKFCKWLIKDNDYTVDDPNWWEKLSIPEIDNIFKTSKDNLNRDDWAVKRKIGHYKYEKGAYAYKLKEYIKKRYKRYEQ